MKTALALGPLKHGVPRLNPELGSPLPVAISQKIQQDSAFGSG